MQIIFKHLIKKALTVYSLFLLGLTSLIFSLLYIENTEFTFIYKNKEIVEVCLTIIITAVTVCAFVFQSYDKKFVFKSTLILFICILLFFSTLYFIKISGIDKNFSSVEDLKNFISSYEKFTVPIFILVQFLQVLILPIPSIITIGASVLCFGIIKGILYSILGIVSASIIAFYLGKVLGVKIAIWLFGEKNLNKILKYTEGKNEIALCLTFIFPFFPDDLLCFTAGIVKMNSIRFILIVTFSRALSITISALFVSGMFLPKNGVLSFVFLLIFFAFAVIIYIVSHLLKGKRNGKNYSARRS